MLVDAITTLPGKEQKASFSNNSHSKVAKKNKFLQKQQANIAKMYYVKKLFEPFLHFLIGLLDCSSQHCECSINAFKIFPSLCPGGTKPRQTQLGASE